MLEVAPDTHTHENIIKPTYFNTTQTLTADRQHSASTEEIKVCAEHIATAQRRHLAEGQLHRIPGQCVNVQTDALGHHRNGDRILEYQRPAGEEGGEAAQADVTEGVRRRFARQPLTEFDVAQRCNKTDSMNTR